MSKILTLTATGVAGLVLGAGIGIAAAGDASTDRPVDRPAASMSAGSMMDAGAMDPGSMDEMHAQMRAAMPAELVEQCDEMHAQMSDHMASGEHGSMMGAGQAAQHAEHHPDTEG